MQFLIFVVKKSLQKVNFNIVFQFSLKNCLKVSVNNYKNIKQTEHSERIAQQTVLDYPVQNW